MATLNDQLRAYLIAQGLVRDPRTAGPLPPCWRSPRDGTPAPGEGTGVEIGASAVIGLVHSGGLTSPRFEKEWRRDIVDIWVRTVTWPLAEDIYVDLRASLIDKTNWMMGSLRIIESLEWRPLQALDSDNQGFTSMCAVLFESYTADHFV